MPNKVSVVTSLEPRIVRLGSLRHLDFSSIDYLRNTRATPSVATFCNGSAPHESAVHAAPRSQERLQASGTNRRS